jgi:hypothetical protein
VDPGKYVVKAGGAPGNAGWYDGDVIHIDLEALNATTDGFWNPATATVPAGYVADYMPPGTTITDVLTIVHDDGHYANPTNQNVQVTNIVGLGTNHIEITIDYNPTWASGGQPVSGINPQYPLVDTGGTDTGSPRRIWVELEIAYPLGTGLTDTVEQVAVPAAAVYPNGPLVENDVTQRPADMETPLSPNCRVGWREVGLEYIASENGGVRWGSSTSRARMVAELRSGRSSQRPSSATTR